VRFEDTTRYVRGRVLAALVRGDAPSVPDVSPARLESALEGLEHDGLIVRDGPRFRLPN
jgi:A/G-specific adenine glycosylase